MGGCEKSRWGNLRHDQQHRDRLYTHFHGTSEGRLCLRPALKVVSGLGGLIYSCMPY
jgi:hypothetical protein